MPGLSCQRACPMWLAPLVLERGGDRRGWAEPRGAWVAGRRAGHQVGSLGKASQMTAYGGVGLVPSYTGFVGRGWEGVSPAPSTKIGERRRCAGKGRDTAGGCGGCGGGDTGEIAKQREQGTAAEAGGAAEYWSADGCDRSGRAAGRGT